MVTNLAAADDDVGLKRVTRTIGSCRGSSTSKGAIGIAEQDYQ